MSKQLVEIVLNYHGFSDLKNTYITFNILCIFHNRSFYIEITIKIFQFKYLEIGRDSSNFEISKQSSKNISYNIRTAYFIKIDAQTNHTNSCQTE